MTVRCKFQCQSSKRSYSTSQGKPTSSWEYEFFTVYSGSDENKAFFQATPTGNLKFSTVNDLGNGEPIFIPGKEYYLDITSAEVPV